MYHILAYLTFEVVSVMCGWVKKTRIDFIVDMNEFFVSWEEGLGGWVFFVLHFENNLENL